MRASSSHCGVMARFIVLLLAALLAVPASAHALRAFARVNGAQVSGYAFFIGGGRPSGAAWAAKMDGATVAEGKTDDEGGYRFAAPSPVSADIVISVDTGDGHFASTQLGPERFDPAPAQPPASTSGDNYAAQASPASTSSSPNGHHLDEADRQLVEEALERQIGPLLERIEAMDARLRLTDLMSGIFLIIGLAGMGLWARGRKR